jgi:DNA-binding response OmpR family regulator
MRVLVVDDEPRYRVYLSAQLGSLGHEVAVAETGRQAIERGLRLLPSVLVSDWMLRNHVHGLHVADALRAVDGGLPAILMTGFPSRDLRSQARDLRIVDFLEKPFELSELVAAVERAGAVRRRSRARVGFGVIVTRGDLCVHASERARALLATTPAGRSPGHVEEIFADEDLSELRAGREEWRLVTPRGAQRTRWWVHWTQRTEDGVLGLVPERKRYLRDDPRLRLLLGLLRASAGGEGAQGKILVVDATPVGQVRYLEQLERTGFACIKAESVDLALRLLAEMPERAIVVIHRGLPDLDLAAFVRALRELRPNAQLIGASDRLSDEIAFLELGLGRFLHVPWRVADLLDALGR